MKLSEIMEIWKKRLLIIIGLAAVGLGALGVFLPLLPTTPFMLLAAACFARSSDKLNRWLLTNKLFGKGLRRYKAGGGIPRHAKVMILITLWGTLGLSIYTVRDHHLVIPILLVLVGVGVTTHILMTKTTRL